MSRIDWRLTGLDCADCAMKLERGLAALTGVEAATVNFASATLVADHDPDVVSEDDIRRRIESLGYDVAAEGIAAPGREAGPGGVRAATGLSRRLPVDLVSVVTAASFTLAGMATSLLPASALGAPANRATAATLLYAAAIVLGGRQIARRAVAAVGLKTLDMNVLMTSAVIGAALIGQWEEGASVVVLFALGNALENRTLERARRGLRELVSLAPQTADVRRQDTEVSVPVAELAVGEHVVVRPGERVPADGVVLEGSSAVQEAAITGEPLPVPKELGAEVWAGSLNGTGFLLVEVRRSAEDNTLARITHMIEDARAEKAPIEQTVERFSRYYTPGVMALALLVAVVPPLLGEPVLESIRRALVMLVIACPCALVISTPVSIVSALSAASRGGVLVKGGRYVEALSRVRAVAFDKTGTLTTGKPVVEEIRVMGDAGEEDALRLAAAVERRAHHPVARAIVELADSRGLADAGAVSFESITGQGAEAEVDGRRILVGSIAYIAQHACDPSAHTAEIAELEDAGKTIAAVTEDGACLAMIVVSDAVRPEAPGSLGALRSVGIERLAMLTGDSARAARALAAGLPFDHLLSGLMPQDKVLAVEQLGKQYGGVAMVGDGINDAPAMAAASVGIAMGAAGSDTALETADVALLGDDLAALPFIVGLAKSAVARIRENVALSVTIKGLFLVLAVSGLATMWMAVFADMGTSLLVTLNAMRLLLVRRRAVG